ncbi:type II CRISPR-associated endonuclease Cas1 [Thiospirochaeta perfilievii]|uniref:CRISPR-associated endonuclease Cas1 n=1 Tax=Thiospirochaeta perfilievii TaxID=252967 RepID=A0A5C1QBG7_9SPIO|nr:type II CRISPR-associated endonuclease Cas1 [Thiospirochaeta perfilievii]QEN04728.1 type II CRISPR-associated endonuclease Cas1 [Thiospirochaeta perfilievii]
MSFRTVLVTSKCKLSYKNEHLYVRSDDLKLIHLSEIEMLIIDSTQVVITTYLLCELVKHKIYIVFCDETHNPQSQLLSLYGSYNTSKKLNKQLNWDVTTKEFVWTSIVTEKIRKQSQLLKANSKEESSILEGYYKGTEQNDPTNREGHAAKVYFNALFGKSFTRDNCSSINKALDYGYSIILSCFNKEVVSNGYFTQLGIWHKSEFNQFNLSSDLMEPFRILIDEYVFRNQDREFNTSYKQDLINILNRTVNINKKEQYVTNAIKIYVKSIFDSLDKNSVNSIKFYETKF